MSQQEINDVTSIELRGVLEQYAVPDPKIVNTIPRNGINLEFVGHAEITKILIDIDPLWSWQPAAWDNGRPAIHVVNDVATMWATLTLCGKQMLGVGSAKSTKPDLDKELVGDFLRNAAMRFGISLALWSKQDWDVQPQTAALPAPLQLQVVRERKAQEAAVSVANHPANVAKTVAKLVEVFDADEVFGVATTKAKSSVVPVAGAPAASNGVSDKQKGLISKLAKEKCDGDITAVLQKLFDTDNLNSLTTAQGSKVIKHLMELR